MRVVLDTNIIVSFLLTKGQTISTIFSAWEKSKFIFLLSDEIFLEVRQVLQRFVSQNLISEKEGRALMRRLKQDCELVITKSNLKLSRDKKDNKLLECAKDGEASYLVTGDKKHLLSLKKIGKTKIISPGEFIRII